MIFNSLAFALFLPLVFMLYWFVFNRSVKLQNAFLIAASYFFYGWWDWRFLFLLIFTSGLDFCVGYGLNRTDDARRRKLLLGVTLASNLSVLFFFKYFNFFVGSAMAALGSLGIHADPVTIKVILPVGISFYTFQSLSYTIDVYRRRLKASEDIFSFMAFVSFFPQLVAGPIERAAHMLPQFTTARRFNYPQAVLGMRLILYGLFKKMVIADNLSLLTDAVFSHAGASSWLITLSGILSFTFQIYGDFSGYSDIAKGTASLFGFDLMRNFNAPYFSLSLREFWQRWHISLSTWFRDYVYIPLGGNRASAPRKVFNLFITFMVSGLWHGANWTFVIWGFIHWCLLAIEELLSGISSRSLFKPIRWFITFSVVCAAWVFFRAKSLHEALSIFRALGHSGTVNEMWAFIIDTYKSPLYPVYGLFVFCLFLAIEFMVRNSRIEQVADRIAKPLRWLLYLCITALIIFFGFREGAPIFIYFNF